MKINTEKFRQALTTVKPGLSSKDIIEQATKFVFMDGKLVTFNDEICIQYPLEELDFSGAINSDELYKLVSKLKTEEVEIKQNEGEVTFSAGRIKAGIVIHKEITLPLEEIDEKKGGWIDLDADFIEGLKFVVSSCSTDMSKQVMTCVCLKGNTFVASDMFRIAKFEAKNDLPIETLIPAKTVREIVSFKPEKMAKGLGGWVHFKNSDGVLFSCRIMADKYPEVNHLFAVKGKKVELPKTMPDILERVSVFTSGDTQTDERVGIKFTKNKMIVESSSDVGWIKETEKIDYSGQELDFIVSPYLFRDIVKTNYTMKVSENRVKFKGKNWEYVAALVV